MATWAVVFGLCLGALPHLFALDGVDPNQADRTLGIIECSLAVLLGHSAWRRRRPEGVLLFVCCLAVVGALVSLADLVGGSSAFGVRTHVVITVAAAAVLARIPLTEPSRSTSASAHAT